MRADKNLGMFTFTCLRPTDVNQISVPYLIIHALWKEQDQGRNKITKLEVVAQVFL